MDHTRASSLETNTTQKIKQETIPDTYNQSNAGRNRLQSLLCGRDRSDVSCSLDYSYGREIRRPIVSNSELKDQLDLLQCTVNKMLNTDDFNENDGSRPSVNISGALKHEYRQMMCALKELETILSLKRKSVDTVTASNTPSHNESQVHHFQHEIQCRDSLIKCLTDRLKILCKANDKLIIDYENQESLLSEELLCLKRQLDKAKDAMRTLAIARKRSNIPNTQDLDNDIHYLRESLCTKDMIISDLKHRIERLNRENTNLKCDLESRNDHHLHCLPSQFERDTPYLKHLNEQMKGQIESLTHSLDVKNCLINDLQNQIEYRREDDLTRHLRQQLMLVNDENDLRKDEILQQEEMLEDLQNQIKMLTENSGFKDDTINELKCYLRTFTDNMVAAPNKDQRTSVSDKSKTDPLLTLLNAVKKHLNQHHPELLSLLGSDSDAYHDLEKFIFDLTDMVNQPSGYGNDIELFKEFLTNEINLKNKVGNFLTNNTVGNIESVEKLQNQLNTLLSIDMDDGFNTDLKAYLHQCYLSDDNLRLVIEYLVKSINSAGLKSVADTESEKCSRGTFMEEKPVIPSHLLSLEGSESKLKSIEEELRKKTQSYSRDREQSAMELDRLSNQKSNLENNCKSLEDQNKKLLDDLAALQDKINDLEGIIGQLKDEKKSLNSNIKQMERNSNLQSAELDHLEKSMRTLSNKFMQLSSTNDSAKDIEIQRLSTEIDMLRQDNKSLQKLSSDQAANLSSLSRELETHEALQLHNSGLEKIVSKLQDELNQHASDRKSMLGSLSDIKYEKDSKIQELQSKLSEEKINSAANQLLKDENKQLLDKLTKCLEEKSNLELNLRQTKLLSADQENSKSMLLHSNLSSLKMENRSLEMKRNSLTSEKTILNAQINQLKNQIDELLRTCADNHVDKTLLKRDTEDSDLCKQKIIDLEAILALLTEELNEKVQNLEEIRGMIKNQPLLKVGSDLKCEKVEQACLNQQLLSQKNSEISFLKSKLDSVHLRKSSEPSPMKTQSIDNSEMVKCKQVILELETQVDLMKQQLNDRSDTISQLQQLIKEKDSIIENAGKMIKTKNDSLVESERLNHLLSIHNTNIKEELSISYEDKSEISLLKTLNSNLRDEMQRLKQENSRLNEELQKLVLSEENRKMKLQNLGSQTKKPATEVQMTSTVEVNEFNEEIHTFYDDVEGKNKEVKEYTASDIKARDKKVDDLNLQLRLKTDQIQKILVENRRLSDKFEDESQRTSNYEKNLLLKEQLLQKMLKEKEKVRATFITELRDKNEELDEKSKTVYFLNAEIHRLSSDLEILDASLHAVKTSDAYNVTQSKTLEISQNDLAALREENTSLKFCVNLKMAETEATRSELTIQRLGNKQLSEEINILKAEVTDRENRLSQRFEENGEAQNTIDDLRIQLKRIKDDYESMSDVKVKLEKAMSDVTEDNRSLKHALEECQNEKQNYRDELERLRNEVELLNDNLTESNEIIARVSEKVEREEENGRRLSIVIDLNEQTKMSSVEELNQAHRQLDELIHENLELKKEIERLITIVRNLEHHQKDSFTLTEQNNQAAKDMERRIRSLEMENENMERKIRDMDNEHNIIVKDLEQKTRSLEMENESICKEMERKVRTSVVESEGMLKEMERKMQSMECDNDLMAKDMERKLRSSMLEGECVIKDLERRIRTLEIENDGMAKELNQYQQLEKQLDERIQRKTIDCEGLKKEHEELLKMLENYQHQIDSIENREQIAQQSLNEELSKVQHLQENLNMAKQQLCNMEEKWTNCNNNWLEKYGQLRDNYEKLDCDYIQLQHHNDTLNLEFRMLETKVSNQCQELNCLNEKNQQLAEDCSRLEQGNLELKHLQCEIKSLRTYNAQMASQIECLNTELVSAHTEIWNAQLKINDTQSTIGKLCARLNNKLTSDRRYGSQPLLDKIDLCSSNLAEMEQRDYNDLKTRYNALCSQIDTLVCQSKKKDKRIADLEGVNEMINYNAMNYEQMKCDYHDLEKRCQQLQTECSDMEQHCHYQDHLQNQNHEINACTDALHETILTQNQELDQLKLANQMLTDDYQACCERLRYLENWRNNCDTKVDHLEYLETEFNELKHQNDNLLSEMDENNYLKHQLIDTRNRFNEVMKCNANLEQQLSTYCQKGVDEKQTIQNLNLQLHNLESYYENEVEQCRKDILLLKDSDKSYSIKLNMDLNEKNHIIGCLNEEIKSIQNELAVLNQQYTLQCDREASLTDELNHVMMMKNDLQHEYCEQCSNIDQLSAQLFDSRDLIEQLTLENRRLTSSDDEKQCQINQLLDKLDKSDECIRDKDHEVRESKRNIALLEDDLSIRDAERRCLVDQIAEISVKNDRGYCKDLEVTTEFNNEVNCCYKMIDNLKDELSKLNSENEKINRIMECKDQQLLDYEAALNIREKDIEKLGSQIENQRIASTMELNELHGVSNKLSGELSYLQDKFYPECRTVETQTSEDHMLNLPSPTPVSEYTSTDHRPTNYKDKSQESDVTYSSSRTVSWKATNTDQREETDGEVVALQQAIEDYNSIVSDINTPERAKMISVKTRSSESQKLNRDVIIVDVDADIPRTSERIKSVSPESKIERASILDVENPRMFDVVQLLKSCKVEIDYDENIETPEVYFCRIMGRYKELEQFFLASLKIQMKQSFDDDTLELFDNFSENMDNNRTVLKEHCRQLNDMLLNSVTELNNGPGEVSAKRLTVKDVKGLIDVIKTQQLQMGALRVGFHNLDEFKTLKSEKSTNIKVPSLAPLFEMLWQAEELCSAAVEMEPVSAVQMVRTRTITTSLSIELLITGATGQQTVHDLSVQLLPNVEVIDNIAGKPVESGVGYIVETKTENIEDNALSHQATTTNIQSVPKKSVTSKPNVSSPQASVQFQTPESVNLKMYNEDIQNIVNREIIDKSDPRLVENIKAEPKLVATNIDLSISGKVTYDGFDRPKASGEPKDVSSNIELKVSEKLKSDNSDLNKSSSLTRDIAELVISEKLKVDNNDQKKSSSVPMDIKELGISDKLKDDQIDLKKSSLAPKDITEPITTEKIKSSRASVGVNEDVDQIDLKKSSLVPKDIQASIKSEKIKSSMASAGANIDAKNVDQKSTDKSLYGTDNRPKSSSVPKDFTDPIISEKLKSSTIDQRNSSAARKYIAETNTASIRDDSYSKKASLSDKADSSSKGVSSKHMSTGIDRCVPKGMSLLATESRLRSTYESPVSKSTAKYSVDEQNKVIDNRQSASIRERTQSQSTKLQATESRVQSPYENVVPKESEKDTRNSSVLPSNIDNKASSIQNEVLEDLTIPLESVQLQKSEEAINSLLQNVKNNKSFERANDTLSTTSIDIKIKLKVSEEVHIAERNDTFDQLPFQEIEQSVHVVIRTISDITEKDPVYLNNFSEGMSVQEAKMKNIGKLDDTVDHASVSKSEKDLHKLNAFDINNLDPSIECNDQLRIYNAEIDYLNEKNVFHSYAINVLSDPSRYAYNSSYLDQINVSLTEKAKLVNDLQSEFKFSPHLSDNEKALMGKVLGSNYTYRKQFDDWIQLQRDTEKRRSNITSVDDLKAQLEQCRSAKDKEAKENERLIKELEAEMDGLRHSDRIFSDLQAENEVLRRNDKLLKDLKSENDSLHRNDKLVKDLQAEKAASQNSDKLIKELQAENKSLHQNDKIIKDLQAERDSLKHGEKLLKDIIAENESYKTQLKKMNTLADENESLKKQLKSSNSQVSKPDSQTATKQSKIPLLKDSSAERPTTSTTKPTQSTVSTGTSKAQPKVSGRTSSMLTSPGQLVSPDDVRTAIASETSIDNLRRFANLLAEDNFDLSAEIEKLLLTIEKLRRQLKENCDILTETVEMLQNSENFVNDLEKSLAAETRKTQVISKRVDELNNLNKQVMSELQRMLKGDVPPASGNMDTKETCDYLMDCLKQLENEYKELENTKLELEKQINNDKGGCGFDFLNPKSPGTLDFQFETVLMPNGSIAGSLSIVHSNDDSKSISVNFDVQSAPDNRFVSSTSGGSKIARFMIERESAVSSGSQKNKKPTEDPPLSPKNNKNDNNVNNNCCHRKCSLSSCLSSHTCTADKYSRPIVPELGQYCLSNSIEDISKIQYLRSHRSLIFNEVMDSNCLSKNSKKVPRFEEPVSNSSLFSSHIGECDSDRQLNVLASRASDKCQGKVFINYRTPIYFRKLYDSQ